MEIHMSKRLFASTGAVAIVMAVVSLASIRGHAAQAAARSTPAVKAVTPWTPPRMPWGDPDISGNFTNVYEEATPLERPDELAGVARSDVKGAELATLLAKRRDARLESCGAGGWPWANLSVGRLSQGRKGRPGMVHHGSARWEGSADRPGSPEAQRGSP